MASQVEEKKDGSGKRKFTLPHVYVLLVSLTILAALGSWVLPAGEFSREMNETINRTVVIPGSFNKSSGIPHLLSQRRKVGMDSLSPIGDKSCFYPLSGVGCK